MRVVKWGFIATLLLIVGGFLHYTLPQRDIVRIVGTYQERQDFAGWTTMFWTDTGDLTAGETTRDVQFIQAIRTDGGPMVYRNQDTGWGWPPYFKFDTASLQTEADDAKSTAEAPKWVAVTHYGWRNELLSIFPNAVAITPVAGPDVTLVPWFNIVLLVILALIGVLIWRMLAQFRERVIDPVVTDAGETWDAMDAKADKLRDNAQGWVARLMARFRKK